MLGTYVRYCIVQYKYLHTRYNHSLSGLETAMTCPFWNNTYLP